MVDLYSTLKIGKKASKKKIKKAFRDLAKKYHPDRDGGDVEKFQDIQHAYMVLYNETSRETYDRDGVVHSAAVSDKVSLAYSNLAALFTQTLESNLSDLETVNLVGICREQISTNITLASEEINRIQTRGVRLNVAKKRLSKKPGNKSKPQNARENILEAVIEEQIINSEKTIKQLRDKISMCEFMSTIIEDYIYQVDQPVFFTGLGISSGSSSTSDSSSFV